MLLIGPTKFVKIKRISFSTLQPSNFLAILFFSSLFTIFGIVAFGGLSFINFDMAVVYEIRREAANAIPGIFGYLNSIVTKVIIPFGMVLSMLQRRWILMGLFFSMSVIFFALTSHKSPLFYPLIVLFFYFISVHPNFKKYFILTLLTGVIFSGLDLWSFVNGASGLSSWFAALFTNRALLVPSSLNSIYIEYFSHYDKYYWATSKLSLGLIESKYNIGASNLIGYKYFGNIDMSANTGWIGSGYANAGYFGVALYSVLIGILFSLLDSYAKKLTPRIVVSLFVLPVMAMLTSADMTDMLLSNGLLVAIFLLFIFDSKKNNTKISFE